MKNKQNIEELQTVGDFTITTEEGKTLVNIVTGRDYGGSRLINSKLTISTVVPGWAPRIETVAEEEVIAKIESISEHYNALANRQCNSCIDLDVSNYAYHAAKGLEQAKTELNARKGI